MDSGMSPKPKSSLSYHGPFPLKLTRKSKNSLFKKSTGSNPENIFGGTRFKDNMSTPKN